MILLPGEKVKVKESRMFPGVAEAIGTVVETELDKKLGITYQVSVKFDIIKIPVPFRYDELELITENAPYPTKLI